MSRIYLRHSKHGEKVAYLEAEAAQDEKNGWVRFDPAAVLAENDEAEDPSSDIVGEAELLRESAAPTAAAVPKRRGRPPKAKAAEAG